MQCRVCGAQEVKREDVVEPLIHYTEIPVYITNRNNLNRGFRDLVNWLIKAGTKHIEVLDNDSTYPSLLEYYSLCPVKVTKLGENKGPWAFWIKALHLKTQTPYIVTDADVVPDKDCPLDLVKKMLEVFLRYKKTGCMKVGPGIRIDNLPDYYNKKQRVLITEAMNWCARMPEDDCFRAGIDTTFALYWTQQGCSHPAGAGDLHYRLISPYVVEHRPWYVNSADLTEEDIYYTAHIGTWSTWRT